MSEDMLKLLCRGKPSKCQSRHLWPPADYGFVDKARAKPSYGLGEIEKHKSRDDRKTISFFSGISI
jgi:hypothetical protein